jgi:hypothetical protein
VCQKLKVRKGIPTCPLNIRHHIKKQNTAGRDWSHYNESLKRRGDMTIWLSLDVITQWDEKDRIYDGTGTPNLYSEMAILTVHEIRQVKKSLVLSS